MQCRSCGTDIADKALICYRCGTATTAAKHQPYQAPRRRRSLAMMAGAALTLLVLLAFFLLNS